MAISFSKLSNSSLRDQIAGKIKEAILNNSLRPGDRLVERKLAAQFGVSLTVVREGLIILEVEGFVVKKTNSSTYVTKLSLQEVEKAFALRRVLEGYAMELAVRSATAEQIESLEKAYLDMIDAAAHGNLDLFLQKDYEWHEAIWCLACNEYLFAALRRLILPLFAFAAIRIHAGSPLDLLADANRHQPLLDAIKSRDVKACHAALNHVTEEWLGVLRAWEYKNPDASHSALSLPALAIPDKA
ncbi:MAG TPA: GntR family transcriptional regulator [Terriglobia bacterium]|nr:GntR family transcriptional regulator [Terriglobia bacterium]